MGLLDSIIGGVLGGGGNTQSGLGSILGSVIASQGGIGGLVQKMNQAGLGDAVDSWVGNGPNRQVDPGQLGQAFGHDQVDQWSRQTGMPHDTILSELSRMLPQVVDRATPNGRVEEADAGGPSPFDAPGLELPSR